MKVPNLKVGQAFRGAEWAGCSNSFNRARIVRSSYFGGFYIVGNEADIDSAMSIQKVFSKLFSGKRVVRWTSPGGGKRKGTKHVVYQFKTRSAAVAKFNELNDVVLAFNAKERERAAKYAAAVKAGDFGTAWQNSD